MEELELIKKFENAVKIGNNEFLNSVCDFVDWDCLDRETFEETLKFFKKLAKNGDFEVMTPLGSLYFFGCKKNNVARNYAKAIYWFRRAAENVSPLTGHTLLLLAYCYKYGRGKNKDTLKAFRMSKALSSIDDSELMYEFTASANICLADCYSRGIGTEKNFEKALAIWKEYAEKSDEAACRNLGREYLSGNNIKRDYDKAFYWTKRAEELGDACATNNLGWCYEKGYGVEKNMDKAIEYYKKAADAGNRIAVNNLKRLNKNGILTDGEL